MLGDNIRVDLIILSDGSQHLQLSLRDIVLVIVDDLSDKFVLIAQKISFDGGPVMLLLVKKDRDGFKYSLDALRGFSERLDFGKVTLAHLLYSHDRFRELVIYQFLLVRHFIFFKNYKRSLRN